MKRYICHFLICFLLFVAACNENKQPADQSAAVAASSIINEDFEAGAKGSYSKAEVRLGKGAWLLDNALIATGSKDAKAGNQSVRIRNKGVLRMEFDANGASMVTIKHSAYQQNKASAWQLQMSVDGGHTYQQVGEDITSKEHRLQTASFTVNTKKQVRFQVVKISGGNNRINIDDFTIYPLGGKSSITTSADSTQSLGTDTPVAGDNSHLLLGNPSNAVNSVSLPNNYLIAKPYYTLSYNRDRGCPNWVSWYVGDEWLGSIKRVNDFRPDNTLPPNWYHVQSTSYIGSGFERGHNCPSADRTNSLKANSATFLMTNMIPQAPANNQHTWGNLESYERHLVNQGNEVYVIMGNYGKGGYGTRGFKTTIDSGRITVPAYIWKVVLVLPNGNNDLRRVTASTRVIAVITPNNNAVNANWTNYLCTVRDIEKATGYDLLSKLPKGVQDAIETRKDAGIDPEDGYIIRL
ncbi:DNA/RNA non-specific endonuclease [Mucilaginibacter sp. PAMB04168]|uniref:DNA/RNA non-specific endonuclease n=1 Tax=Mucilaginibacter sp. PAMB04168 TaxID=3138567 RepID=UPI0031F6FD63